MLLIAPDVVSRKPSAEDSKLALPDVVADNLHAPTHRVLIPYVLDELDKL